MTDDFKTVTLRVNKSTRTALLDGFQDLRYGDSLKLVVDNVCGVDETAVSVSLWKKDAGNAPGDVLAFSDDFDLVEGKPGRMYTTLDLFTANMLTATGSLALGTPVEVRLMVLEGDMPLVDMDVEVYPNPGAGESPTPSPADPFVRKSSFASVSAIQAMPTLTAAQREARMEALLVFLEGLSG